MITNTITGFALNDVSSNGLQMTAGQAFAIVLDGTTTVRRGLVVHPVSPSGSPPQCWLEGVSHSGRNSSRIDLYPASHGVPLPILKRVDIRNMSELQFAAFQRLIPTRVRSLLPRKVGVLVQDKNDENDQVVANTTPFENGPSADPAEPTNRYQMKNTKGVGRAPTIVKRIDGKAVRVKFERAPCSPPTTDDEGAPCKQIGYKRPVRAENIKRRRSEPQPQPTQSTGGRIATKSKKLQDDQEAMTEAVNVLEGKVAEVTKTVEAVVDKVSDLSKQLGELEGILVQKGFF